MFPGSFPRMKHCFIYEARGEKRLMILLTVSLFNQRIKKGGLNQIEMLFVPFLSTEVQFLYIGQTGLLTELIMTNTGMMSDIIALPTELSYVQVR